MLEEVNNHWSYCLNGNDLAVDYSGVVLFLVIKGDNDGLDETKLLLSRTEIFKKILAFLNDYQSRLPMLILGTRIMGIGADLPEEFRKDLLDFADWEKYEEEQLREEEYSYLRKEFLLEFQEMVETYDNGSARIVTYETEYFAYNKYHFKHKLTPIDYSL